MKHNSIVELKRLLNNGMLVFSLSIVSFICYLTLVVSLHNISTDKDIYLIHSSYSWVFVYPGKVFFPSLRIWTIFTTSFFQFHWYWLTIDIIVLFLCGCLLESIWGRRQLFFYIIIVNSLSVFMVSLIYILIYMLNGNEDYLFHQPLIGHFPLYMALAVAVKQLMPHTIISNYSFIRITNKDIPFLLLIVSTTLSILHILDLSVTLRLYSSLIISWIYLRYFHYSSSSSSSSSSLSSSSSNQNRETDFTFHSFFPASIQPYVILLFQIISFGRCGTKKKSSAHTLPMTNDTVIQLDQLNSPIFDLYNLKPKSFVPTKSAIATAKRQQKALDLLNERVQKQAQLSKLSKFDDVTPIVIPGNIEQVSAVTEKSNLNTISEIPQMSTQNKKIVSTTQQQLTDCDDVE